MGPMRITEPGFPLSTFFLFIYFFFLELGLASFSFFFLAHFFVLLFIFYLPLLLFFDLFLVKKKREKKEAGGGTFRTVDHYEGRGGGGRGHKGKGGGVKVKGGWTGWTEGGGWTFPPHPLLPPPTPCPWTRKGGQQKKTKPGKAKLGNLLISYRFFLCVVVLLFFKPLVKETSTSPS